jgi:hypothetical protein
MLAIDEPKMRDRASQCRLLGEAERGLLQQRWRVLAGVAEPVGGQAQMRPVVACAQLMTAID